MKGHVLSARIHMGCCALREATGPKARTQSPRGRTCRTFVFNGVFWFPPLTFLYCLHDPRPASVRSRGDDHVKKGSRCSESAGGSSTALQK